MAKQEKKPLVNWLKRKKEVSFRDSTTADGKTLKVTEKKVTAPDSKLSKGFDKTKVSVKVERKDPKLASKIGKVAGGIGAMVSGMEHINVRNIEKGYDRYKNTQKWWASKQEVESENKKWEKSIDERKRLTRGAAVVGMAAPVAGVIVDKIRGKEKKVTVSKTKTKKK